MHRAKRADNSPLFDRDMSRQRGCVHQHGMIANHAVVPDMRVGHDEDVAADACDASALGGAARDGDVLTDDVVIADLETRWFAPIRNVLRVHAQRGKGKYLVVFAETAGAAYHNVGYKFAVLTQFDAGVHDAVRPDAAGLRNFRGWVDNRCRMNLHARA
jgi:hypothetical protein